MKNTSPHRINYGEGVFVLVESYDLKYMESTVGTVDVEKVGRYYRIYARHRLREKGPLRLMGMCGIKQLDLGLCVEYKDQQGTVRWLPISRLGEGALKFFLQEQDSFVPIYESQPFAYLDKVIRGRFALRGGVPGVVFGDDIRQITPL